MLQRLKSWWVQDATQLTYLFVPDGGGHLVPSNSYLRLWLSDLFLAKSRQRSTDRHPSLQASVQLAFAGNPGMTFPVITHVGNDQPGPGVLRSRKLTELLPYTGGTVAVQAALLDIEGDSQLRLAVGLVSEFASLLTPPLSTVAALAATVTSGIDRIDEAAAAAKKRPVLVFDSTLASAGGGGANTLTSGYHVVVRAPQETFCDGQLTVAEDVLVDTATGSKLTGYDYFVLRIEGRTDRDDWRFPAWDALIGRTLRARIEGQEDDFRARKASLLGQIFASPDLTPADRPRVAQLVKEELDAFTLGAAGDEQPDTVADIVASRGLPDSLAVASLTFDALVA
jgi:hypothetical protein